MDAQRPDLLASDAEREHAAEILRAGLSEGRLTTPEFEERLHAVYGARTRSELEPLVADVSAAPLAPASAGPPARGHGGGGTHLVLSVMSGTARRGHWRVARHCTVLDVMGGSELDLSQAQLPPEGTTITVVSVMGGSKIRLPEHTRVEVSKLALMGGNDVRLQDSAEVDPTRPPIRIRLFALMGGNDVRQGRRRRRRELTS